VVYMFRNREQAAWWAGEPMFQYALANEAAGVASGVWRGAAGAWPGVRALWGRAFGPRVSSVLNRVSSYAISRIANRYWTRAQSLYREGIRYTDLHGRLAKFVDKTLAPWARSLFNRTVQAEVYVDKWGKVVFIGAGKAPQGSKAIGDVMILKRGQPPLKIGDNVRGKLDYGFDAKSGQRRASKWLEDQSDIRRRTGLEIEFGDLPRHEFMN